MSVAKMGDSLVFIPSMIAGADGDRLLAGFFSGGADWTDQVAEIASDILGQSRWPVGCLRFAVHLVGLAGSQFLPCERHMRPTDLGAGNATPHISSLLYWNKRMAGSLPSQYY